MMRGVGLIRAGGARADGRRRMARSLWGSSSLRPLVAVHGVTSAADALFTVSLAGSLFFGVSVDAARPRVLFYLLLTMAPFAVVAPLLGPLSDRVRGGYRTAIVVTAVGRASACGLLVAHLSTLLLFPEAFVVLVLAKTYSVAKSALVPRLVDDPDRFVAANALLARAGSTGSVVAGAVGAVVLQRVGGSAVVGLAAGLHVVAGGLALRVPSPATPARPVADVVADIELHNARLIRSAAALTMVRFAVGYVAFTVAIDLKATSAPVWVFGLVLLAGAVAGFAGSMLAWVLRTFAREETLLAGSLLLPGAVALLAGAQYGRASAAVLAGAVAFAAAVGVHSFDSLVQQLAPDAEKGRTFAQFETRFQLAWVLGATGPVLFRPSGLVGFLVLGTGLVAASVAYITGMRSLAPTPTPIRLEPILSAAEPLAAAELLALGRALQTQGSHRLALLVAVEATRVADQNAQQLRPTELTDELDRMWHRAATEPVVSPVDADRAIALASELVHGHHGGTQGPSDVPGSSTAVQLPPAKRTENLPTSRCPDSQ
jgi:hypothetical protein